MTRPALALLLLAGALAACSAPAPTATLPALAPVAALDLARYAGGWYEVAKFPNWFQRHCVADTKAEYRPMPGGRVQVVNRCRNEAGGIEQAIGTARPDGSGAPARLEVTFVPGWLSGVPFLWADYWVIDLDPGYQLVAVSEPRRKYLWILSRTPYPDASAYAALRARLQQQGFDLGKLEATAQSN